MHHSNSHIFKYLRSTGGFVLWTNIAELPLDTNRGPNGGPQEPISSGVLRTLQYPKVPHPNCCRIFIAPWDEWVTDGSGIGTGLGLSDWEGPYVTQHLN